MVNKGYSLFSKPCQFVIGATCPEQLVGLEKPQIAFIGRSNCGKSSLINALTRRQKLAKTSSTPGRTQQINFFNLGDIFYLVDLPGYGFSKTDNQTTKKFQNFVKSYLKKEVNLKQVFILIDIRRGICDIDEEWMRLLDEVPIPYQIVLTKSDQIVQKDLTEIMEKTFQKSSRHGACHPKILCVSSLKDKGLDELRDEIFDLVG